MSAIDACKFLDGNILACALDQCNMSELGFTISEEITDDPLDILIMEKFLDNNYYKTFNYDKFVKFILQEKNLETTKKLFDHLENYGMSLHYATDNASILVDELSDEDREVYDKIMDERIFTYEDLFKTFEEVVDDDDDDDDDLLIDLIPIAYLN